MHKRLLALLLALNAAIVGSAAQERNGLDVQKARAEHVSGRAKKVYYTHPWDLSDLPMYKPEQQVSGTIREWGSNYFQDSNLNNYWEAAFHKYQPDIKFDYHMRTALEAAPALATGVADLAACRLFTFSDEALSTLASAIYCSRFRSQKNSSISLKLPLAVAQVSREEFKELSCNHGSRCFGNCSWSHLRSG